MRAAIAAAAVGDEQKREDPTVNELERRAAQVAEESRCAGQPVLWRKVSEVDLGEEDGTGLQDDLERDAQAGREPERGAQDLVPRHGRGQGTPQCSPVEPAAPPVVPPAAPVCETTNPAWCS